MSRPRASVYIDGFNLYRRVLQGHPALKWVDLELLAKNLLPDFEILRVRYFTAIIKVLPGADITSPQRQQAYLRALATLPDTTVHLGKFRIDKRLMPVHPTELLPDGQPRKVCVKKTEEKGSDVALASHLLLDAFSPDADVFVVLSNDSDLVTPLRLVKNELGREIGLVSPVEPKRASNELKQTSPGFHLHVTHDLVARSQLPDTITDAHGLIRRPRKWARTSEGPTEVGPSNQ